MLISEAGSPVYSSPITADESALPVDPQSEPAPGYAESQRGAPGGFIADPDVMDTWATSSLTPLITGRWGTDDDLFARVFPMDLRAQSHEIIRTWLFSTVVRSELEFGELPFADWFGRPQLALVDGEPRNALPFGRHVAPALSVPLNKGHHCGYCATE